MDSPFPPGAMPPKPETNPFADWDIYKLYDFRNLVMQMLIVVQGVPEINISRGFDFTQFSPLRNIWSVVKSFQDYYHDPNFFRDWHNMFYHLEKTKPLSFYDSHRNFHKAFELSVKIENSLENILSKVDVAINVKDK